jgi:hypothetical protein
MSEADNKPVEWVETDKFVMGVIPEELGIDPLHSRNSPLRRLS